jgi:hypothetical protein
MMSREFNNYARSTMGYLALLLAATACAGPNQLARGAPRVDFGDIALGQEHPTLAQRFGRAPFILHFRAGDEVPVDFALQSRLFRLDTASWKLVAKRDFYVLFLSDAPPRLSEDGVDFEEHDQNSFLLGLRLRRGKPADIQIRLAVHPEAAGAAR